MLTRGRGDYIENSQLAQQRLWASGAPPEQITTVEASPATAPPHAWTSGCRGGWAGWPLTFSVSRVGVTNQNLPLAYGDQAGMQLFLWSGSAFIIWVCLSVIHACLEFW